jgi:Kdo2-lipid IVA lauroyltransferase/acyltransferase
VNVQAATASPRWVPAPGWEWDRNTTHRSGYLNPIAMFTRFVPRPVNHALAVGLGSILAFVMRKTRRVLRHNLERVGRGGFPEAKISRLILQTFHNYARYLVDYMSMTHWGLSDIPGLFRRFHGRDVFEAALREGKGVLLVTPHLGNWELGGAFLSAQGFPLNVVSLVVPDRATVEIRERVRERLGIRHLYVGRGESPLAMIGIANALRRNEIVAMLCDRDAAESSAEGELFGCRCRLPVGPVILSQVTGAPIIPSFVIFRNGLYEAFIGKPIRVPGARGPDREKVLRGKTREIVREFEKAIARFPDQWYNFYPSWIDGAAPRAREAVPAAGEPRLD